MVKWFYLYFAQTAAYPEIAFLKYFCIPLGGFSLGCVIFLGIVRNGWKVPSTLQTFIDKHYSGILLLISCLFLVYFSALAVLRYTSFHSTVLDMGVYDNKIWRISSAPLNSILYETARGHFQPILIFYALLYKVIDSPVIILFLQAAVTLSGIIPLYLLSKKHLKRADITLLIALAYLFFPAVGFNALLDFHPDHLYIPLMLWAFYFAEKESYITAVAFAGLGAMAKEPLILGAAFFGLYLVFAKKQYKIGTTIFLFYLFLFFIIVYIILPYTNQLPAFQDGTFPFLANKSAGMGIANIQALRAALLTWKTRKLLFIYFLFGPVLFLPLLEWRRLLPALPMVAVPFLSTASAHSSLDSQYTAGLIAPVFAALIFSLRKMQDRYGSEYAVALAGLVAVMVISFHVANAPGPFSVNFWKSGWAETWHRSNYVMGEHEKIIKEAICNIPENPGKTVMSQDNINYARLAHRYRYCVFSDRAQDADYIILDTKRTRMIGDRVDGKLYLENLQRISGNPGFHLEFQKDGVLLFKRIEA